jgi:hypothetical protein
MIYTRSQLKSRVNAGIHGRIGVLLDENDFIDDVIRSVISDMDIRSTIRRGTLTPKLFNGIYEYTAMTDLKEMGIIDIPAQIKRDNSEWYLVTPTEFERLKGALPGAVIGVDHYNGTPKLLLSKNIDDENRIIAELDAITSGGGTWEIFGDAENLVRDNDNFVKGAGSLKFDISSAGGTTAGIKNTNLDEFDIDDFLGGNGSCFVWVYLSSKDDITNFILRLGQDESNYYSKTVTSQHDGTAFAQGWNLLRFDLTSLSETGSPATLALDYASVYMTKAAGKISETDYRVDWMVLKRGEIYNVKYYSKFGWISSAGVYKENSTDDSDLVIADTTEYEMYILKGKQMAAEEANEFEIAEKYAAQYETKKVRYVKQNPSERKIMSNEYHKF